MPFFAKKPSDISYQSIDQVLKNIEMNQRDITTIKLKGPMSTQNWKDIANALTKSHCYKQITSLELSNCSGDKCIDFILSLPGLKTLNIVGIKPDEGEDVFFINFCKKAQQMRNLSSLQNISCSSASRPQKVTRSLLDYFPQARITINNFREELKKEKFIPALRTT